MGLDIYFLEDVANTLMALAQANDRALALALRFGADPELARLARDVYAGALLDVAASFGLASLEISRSDHPIPLGLAQSDRVLSIRKERR